MLSSGGETPSPPTWSFSCIDHSLRRISRHDLISHPVQCARCCKWEEMGVATSRHMALESGNWGNGWYLSLTKSRRSTSVCFSRHTHTHMHGIHQQWMKETLSPSAPPNLLLYVTLQLRHYHILCSPTASCTFPIHSLLWLCYRRHAQVFSQASPHALKLSVCVCVVSSLTSHYTRRGTWVDDFDWNWVLWLLLLLLLKGLQFAHVANRGRRTLMYRFEWCQREEGRRTGMHCCCLPFILYIFQNWLKFLCFLNSVCFIAVLSQFPGGSRFSLLGYCDTWEMGGPSYIIFLPTFDVFKSIKSSNTPTSTHTQASVHILSFVLTQIFLFKVHETKKWELAFRHHHRHH